MLIFLHFDVVTWHYPFVALPFDCPLHLGFSPAPVFALLHLQGISYVRYLDDHLFQEQSSQALSANEVLSIQMSMLNPRFR